MIRPTAAAVVYLCVAPIDLRKQAASLALLVEQSLKRDVFAAALYVFSNSRRDRIRILYWERNGLVLWLKRLEKERFIWPRVIADDTVSMTGEELNRLLDGFDVWAQGPRTPNFAPGSSRETSAFAFSRKRCASSTPTSMDPAASA